MSESVISPKDLSILAKLAFDSVPGCFVEVGVYKGGSAKVLETIAVKQGREFYCYDTFEGMPFKDEKDWHSVKDFSDTSYERVKALLVYSTVVKGVFPDSAVPMPPIAFAHIDCDQYKSIQDSCRYLEPLMTRGGVMYFDDYNVKHLPYSTEAVNDLYGDRIQLAENKKAFVVF